MNKKLNNYSLPNLPDFQELINEFQETGLNKLFTGLCPMV